jgi:molybdate transport system regulatory protein
MKTPLKARLRIRVDFEEGTILSPGKVRLFELLDESGSLEQAAATIQMDLQHARRVIERLERFFGGPLIETETDGSNAGRSKLTTLGRKVVKRYYAAERVSADAAERALHALVGLAQGNKAVKRKVA